MSDRAWRQEIISLVGFFLGGFTAMYWYTKAAPTGIDWMACVMAGVGAVVPWLTGYRQTNPDNQPKTPEQLLASVQKSVMPPDVKALVAAPLAVEAASPRQQEPPIPPGSITP